jgi:Fur family transcriptional regulator, peroxide stress response regulator
MQREKSATHLSSEVAAFAEHCRKSGLSVTRQRLAIFEALAASREHPSAEDLHRAVRKRIPHLSLATVYKNLEALRDIGAVSDVNALHEHGRYEAALPGTGAGSPHHHLVCIRCRKVVDLHDAGLDDLQVSDPHGFEVHALKVQVEGICPECARGKKSQRSVNATVTASR